MPNLDVMYNKKKLSRRRFLDEVEEYDDED